MSGRPTDYSPELALRLCTEIADGKSLRTICDEEWSPCRTTVFVWLQKHKEFADQYARAREMQAEALADELNAIADDGRNDWMEYQNDKGEIAGWKLNGENVQRSRLRIDTRKWVAAKLLPKKYGEKQQIEHSTDPERPLTLLVSSAEELRAKIRGQ